MTITSTKEFLHKESAGGVLIIAAAVLAFTPVSTNTGAAPPMQPGRPE